MCVCSWIRSINTLIVDVVSRGHNMTWSLVLSRGTWCGLVECSDWANHGFIWNNSNSFHLLMFLYHTASVFESKLFLLGPAKTVVLLITKFLYYCCRDVIFKVMFTLQLYWTVQMGWKQWRDTGCRKCVTYVTDSIWNVKMWSVTLPTEPSGSPDFVSLALLHSWYSSTLILPRLADSQTQWASPA